MMKRIEVAPAAAEKTEKGSVLNDLFKPIFLYLHIVGTSGLTGFEAKGSICKRSISILYNIYVFAMVMALLSLTGAYLYELCFISSYSMKWFHSLSLTILGTLCVTFVIATVFKFRDQPLRTWKNSFIDFEMVYGLNRDSYKMSKKMRIVHKVSQVFGLGILVGGLLILFMWPEMSEVILVEILPRWLNQILLTILLVCFISGFLFMMSCLYTAAMLFTNEYTSINLKMKALSLDTKNRKDKKDVDQRFSSLYEQHDHLTTLLDEFNECVSYFLTLTYFISLPLTCVMFYFILTKVDSSADALIVSIMMLTGSLPATVFCILGCRLNGKAHQVQQYLFKISLSDLSETTLRQIMMLTTKLTGLSIGFRVFNTFTITPEASLSIVGTLITYLIVVVQFAPTSSPSSLDHELITNLTACCSAAK